MIIFNGKKEAEEILGDLKERILKEEINPVLAVVSAGRNLASELFIKNKKIAAEKIGIKVVECPFEDGAEEGEVTAKVRQLNEDSGVNGIIVQLPLPKNFNVGKILKEVSPEKDVDGFGEKAEFLPPLISAILVVLKELGGKIKEKEFLAIVNSDIFGSTLGRFLSKEGLKINYLLNEDIPKERDSIKKADIIITALGNPKFIKGDMIKKEVILIDAGIVVSDFGKVVGDIDKESVMEKASFLTPVPGGIGPLTVAFLLKNVYLSAKK